MDLTCAAVEPCHTICHTSALPGTLFPPAQNVLGYRFGGRARLGGKKKSWPLWRIECYELKMVLPGRWLVSCLTWYCQYHFAWLLGVRINWSTLSHADSCEPSATLVLSFSILWQSQSSTGSSTDTLPVLRGCFLFQGLSDLSTSPTEDSKSRICDQPRKAHTALSPGNSTHHFVLVFPGQIFPPSSDSLSDRPGRDLSLDNS